MPLFFLLFFLFFSFKAYTEESTKKTVHNKEEIKFNAKTIILDQNTNILTASGNVNLKYKGVKLNCDELIYDQINDTAIARGNVTLIEPSGSYHQGEELNLNNDFSKFFMVNIYSRLQDGSQMRAKSLSFDNQRDIIYERASYTPCNCDFKNNENPIWLLSAKRSIHNEKTRTIRHDGVRMHIFNIPLLYLPTFAHPDWTVKRKTGFLAPILSISQGGGFTWSQPFFINKSENADYTLTPTIFSNNGILNEFEYRQALKNGFFQTNFIGGRVNTVSKDNEDVIAGFINYNKLLKNDWQTNLILKDTSEDSFLRKYKLKDETVLKSIITSEKITDNSYTSVEVYKIGSLSRQTDNDNSPLIMPSLTYEKEFELPSDYSYGKFFMSSINLQDDEGLDMTRYSNIISASKNQSIANGLGYIDSSISIDLYDISNNSSSPDNVGNITSLNSYLTVGWKRFTNAKILNNLTVLKPQFQVVGISGTDKVDVIPNRDAADYRLDEANIFLPHRPQGRDLKLSGGRFDYGLSSFLTNDSFGELTSFIGQSIKLWGGNEREFQSLKSKDVSISQSDYIARFALQHSNTFSSDWSGRLDPYSFEIHESITTLSQNIDMLDLSASHSAISKGYLEGANGAENLELKFKTNFSSDWNLSGSQNYNLFGGETKLLKTGFGLSYSGGLQDCLAIELNYERETKTDPSITPMTEVSLIFQFKYLGGIFETL